MTGSTSPLGNRDPLVSAVLPVFNGESFLAETLDSIFAQTYPALEVIVIDDGSTDQSLAIIEEYVEKFRGRLRIISIPNSGVSVARNVGIEQAKGFYIAFIDQDDLWVPEKVARQVGALVGSGARVSFTNVAVIDADGHLCSSHVCRFPAGDTVDWFETVLFNPMVGISTVMMERSLFIEAGRFSPEYKLAEDYDLILRVLAWNYPEVVDEDLLRYREHRGSGTFTKTDALVSETLAIVDRWRSECPEVFRRNRVRYLEFRLRLLFLMMKGKLG